MIERLSMMYPEIALFVTTCVVMVLGLSRTLTTRKMTAVVAGVGVVIAGILAATTTPSGVAVTASVGQTFLPELAPFAKTLIAIVGLLMLLTLAGTVDRGEESRIAAGVRAFDPLRSNRAEFYAFYLFSLTGLMLTAGADSLIWLFLALELTSLPTYIMVAISTPENRGREAGVKYFFLGAMGAAVFLYGFSLIYGATGSTNLNEIHAHIASNGLSPIALAGVMLSLLGFMFKIAAVPMHFYTADVYQGSAPQVSAFLAFVPKTAGFIAILLVCGAVGWSYAPAATGWSRPIMPGGGNDLPETIRIALWVIAALTMTVGNILAILQTSLKRLLAYSSIAHSGYMLVGVVAGPGDGSFSHNGISAVLFYLLCYGVMNLGVFAVLACIEKGTTAEGEPIEADSFADIRGLCSRSPALGWTLVICSLSLLGLPPLLGFFGKLPLFSAAISSNEIPLVVVLGINSAIAAFYYLRLAFASFLEPTEGEAAGNTISSYRSRTVAAVLSAGGVIILSIAGNVLIGHAAIAGKYVPGPVAPVAEQDKAAEQHAAVEDGLVVR
jgi:NADH-quinone oxidoreductase subunit N